MLGESLKVYMRVVDGIINESDTSACRLTDTPTVDGI